MPVAWEEGSADLFVALVLLRVHRLGQQQVRLLVVLLVVVSVQLLARL